MLYRQRMMLALIEAFGGRIDKLHLQKLLFLLSQRQERPAYEFVPYQYGPYSFTAQRDLYLLIQAEFVGEEKNILRLVRLPTGQDCLGGRDLQAIQELCGEYRHKKTKDLLKELYKDYPYYATRSKIVHQILGEKAKRELEEQSQAGKGIILFTIGYEKRSLENYLNALIENQIRVLVDVRKNPISMKFGFSKCQLAKYCGLFGIEYEHFPELGIDSALRKGLHSDKDYLDLFSLYRRETLPSTVPHQQKILRLLREYSRVALTCFEADNQKCHRSHLAEAINMQAGFTYEIVHL